MIKNFTKRPRRLSFAATLIVFGIALAVYYSFRNAEVDRQIQKEFNN
jgi:uncharacterized membrane protein YidH (DUF202 family)